MIAFWVLVVLLVAVALFFVVRPLLAKHYRDDVVRERVNVAIYRDQLRELDSELKAGTLSAEQHEKTRREMEARLIADARAHDAVAAAPPRRAFKSAIALAALVPIGAFGVYLLV